MFVEVQRGSQRFAESVQRDVFGCVLAIRTRAEAPVDRLVRVQEENGEGEIVIKLEERQVQRIGLDQADADELVHYIGHRRIVTNQLFVKSATLQSRDAANDDQQWFALARRLGQTFRQIVVDPVAGGLDFLAVIQHALFAVFGGGEGRHAQKQPTGKHDRGLFHGAYSCAFFKRVQENFPAASRAISSSPGDSGWEEDWGVR